MTEETKYGDRIADHDWSDPQPTTEANERVKVDKHKLDIIYVTDPSKDMGYGREKYTVHINYTDASPEVLYVVEHKWKGNYWRDVTDWDFRDIPDPVRQQVAAVLPVDRPEALDLEERLMDKEGENRWQKHHKPRMESLSGDEIFGTSFLQDAMQYAEKAAESFEEGSNNKRLSEKCVKAIQGVIKNVEDGDE